MLPPPTHITRVDQVAWREILPVLRLVGLFRHAIQPSKLVIAWVLVFAVWLLGEVLAWALAPGIDAAAREAGASRRGYYHGWIARELDALRDTATAALQLDLGLGGDGGVVGGLLRLLGGVTELAYVSPVFCGLYLLLTLAGAMLAGGALCRLMSREACLGETAGLIEGVGFASRKLVWLLIAPLLPLAVVAAVIIALVLLGLVLFNLPVLDAVGGLLLGPMFVLGFVAALALLGLLLAVHLLPAALAVEGTDAYDAVSRSFAYVAARPWQLLGYAVFALAYGMATFTFMVVLAYATFTITRVGLDAGTFTDFSHTRGEPRVGAGAAEIASLTVHHADRLDAIVPSGEAILDEDRAPRADSGSAGLAAWFASRWTQLLASIPAAYAVSFYFCATTLIYLLLRRSAEGSGFGECDGAAAALDPLDPIHGSDRTGISGVNDTHLADDSGTRPT